MGRLQIPPFPVPGHILALLRSLDAKALSIPVVRSYMAVAKKTFRYLSAFSKTAYITLAYPGVYFEKAL